MATRKISSAAETAEVSFVKRCPKEIQQLYRADMANLRPEHRGAKAYLYMVFHGWELADNSFLRAPADLAAAKRVLRKFGWNPGLDQEARKIGQDRRAEAEAEEDAPAPAHPAGKTKARPKKGGGDIARELKIARDEVAAPRTNVQRSYRRLERLAYIWRWQKDPETGKMNFALPRITADALRRSPPGSKPAVFRVRRPQVPKSDPFKA